MLSPKNIMDDLLLITQNEITGCENGGIIKITPQLKNDEEVFFPD